MSIIRYRPWSLLSSIQEELNNALSSNFSSFDEEDRQNSICDWSPRVDVKEEDKHFVVYADIPGVDPKNIKVSIENNSITIKGDRKSEKHTEKKGKYSRIERHEGSFFRQFTLPNNIDKEKIKAKSKNGVLELFLPKKLDEKTKLIEIDVNFEE